MTITELVTKLIELGWYVSQEFYIDSNHGINGMATIALPALGGEPFFQLSGWPLFTYHPIFGTWSATVPATQSAVDWLKQIAEDTDLEDD